MPVKAAPLWVDNANAGYLSSPKLSHILRMALQPSMKFTQLTSFESAVGKHQGNIFHWPLFSNISSDGAELRQDSTIPVADIDIDQGTLYLKEHGQSVKYSGTLDDLSELPITGMIQKGLRDAVARYMDKLAHAAFSQTPLVVCPKSGTSPTEVELAEDGVPAAQNAYALTKKHVKAIGIIMRERNIPTHDPDCYVAIGRPSAFETLTDDLEAVLQYTPSGIEKVLRGEKGRYEGFRFVEQTNVPSKKWTSGKSDEIFFCGGDGVVEGAVVPPEIRGMIGQDFGRNRGFAWYYHGGHALAIPPSMPEQSRIVKWGSTS